MRKAPPPTRVRTTPTPEDFLTKEGLYRKYEYAGEDLWDAVDVLYFKGTYDNYCLHCEKSSTFQAKSAAQHPKLIKSDQIGKAVFEAEMAGLAEREEVIPDIRGGYFDVFGICTRVDYHQHKFVFKLEVSGPYTEGGPVSGTLEKIGQYPAIADLSLPLTKRFRGVLTKGQHQELNKAIGLHSHGVGAGAYVYLRRIFEGLIEQAHQDSKQDANWDEPAYATLRMAEKIAAVKTHLPDFLVQNHGMYAVLSKGIHELSEEDCLKFFNPMLAGIELILDEKLERKQKADRIAEATKAIDEAHQAAKFSDLA